MEEDYATREDHVEGKPTPEFLPVTDEQIELDGAFVPASGSRAANPHGVAIDSLG